MIFLFVIVFVLTMPLLELYFPYVFVIFFFVCIYRATTGVEEPICILPAEKVALGELLAPGHLE